MKEKNSNLSKDSNHNKNTGNDSQTQKETSPEEIARKYWLSVTHPTSQEETTLSKQKEEQTKPSLSDGNSSNFGA